MKTYSRRWRVSGLLGGLAVITPLLLGGAGPAAAEWTRIGPYQQTIHALAIDPQNPTTVYAATGSYGVFKSTHAGANWSAVNTELPNYLFVYALAVDPQTPSTLYAGTNNYGVFKSTDGAASWSAVNTGLMRAGETCSVQVLAVDPQTPTTLYAGTKNGGVFKSTNGGASWGAVNAGLPSPIFLSVSALAVDPEAPTPVYAANLQGGVFKWTALCTLTVGKGGSGDGTVTSNPLGIQCGSDCRNHYAGGTPVALTATPSAGSSFTDWSGDCTGSGSCIVTLEEPRTVTATFSLGKPVVSLAATSPIATERGRVKGIITATRLGSTVGSLTVYYSVTGTATPGTDYTTSPSFNYATQAGSLTIPDGNSTARITLTSRPDRGHEQNESVLLTLRPHATYTLGSPSTARVVILNEDSMPAPR